jgi:EAL domain-containing protein (putative c-di-GMP-specific phosphodiesterase class I)/CHASE2 domain-containing sensor protein
MALSILLGRIGVQKIFEQISRLNSNTYIAVILASSLIFTMLAGQAGVGTAIDDAIKTARSSIFAKQASDDIIIVELDAKSIQNIGTWPWPRDVHANLIKKLSDSGAQQIAFDVDFSARSNPQSDNRLAEAIKQSDATIILATFRQKSGSQNLVAVENLPLSQFRDNAILASVNVHPDANGRVDLYSFGEVTGDTLRPSLGAMLSSSNGRLGESFRIDRAIDPAGFATISAIDILNGRFAADSLQGKTIIIGASAIELGDFYATSQHGVVPGVLIHALAAETLKNGDAMPVFGNGLSVTFVFLVLLVSAWLTRKRKSLTVTAIAPISTACALIIFELAVYKTAIADIAIGYSLVLALTFLMLSLIAKAIQNMRVERYSDNISGLPNSLALQKFGRQLTSKKAPARLAILQIANYNEVYGLCSRAEWNGIVQSLAKRLRFLTERDKVFKTGDDQLAWVVPQSYMDNLEEYFETISAFFLAPFNIGAQNFRLNIHCGYHEHDNDDWAQLQANASIAAFKATELGYRWLTYSNDINAVAKEKMALLNDVDKAMDDGDIWVAYQPKLDLHSNKICSAEALARWEHPKLGNIRPDRFITILENEGKITDLTLYILRIMLNDIEYWTEIGNRISCSINISVALLDDDDFIREALTLIDLSPVDNAQVIFEITETASVQSLDEAARVLTIIRETGVKISIDDYGTGQSTLSYLRGFPADEIKVDQAFIRNIATNKLDKVMVASSIDLAHQMNFKVVAEGVEDLETLNILKDQGCDIIQGWHIGKPVNAQNFEEKFISNAPYKIANG